MKSVKSLDKIVARMVGLVFPLETIPMHLYIPTLNRSGKQKTLANFPPELCESSCLVINHADYKPNRDIYKGYAETYGCGIIIVPPSITGIARVREYIGQRAAADKVRKFIMVDDDLSFFHRENGDIKHLYKNTPKDTLAAFTKLDELLDTYAHASISMRQGNNHDTNHKPGHPFRYNTRYVRVLGFQTKPFNSCIHGRVNVMEDFDVSLQLLEKGYQSIVMFEWAQDQAHTQDPGGCSTYRTHQMQEEAARQLMKLHPGLISLKLRRNSTGGEFGARYDVVVQWQKAYQDPTKKRSFF